jgi:hypothetical protein
MKIEAVVGIAGGIIALIIVSVLIVKYAKKATLGK